MEIKFNSNGKILSYDLNIDARFFENYRKYESLYFSNIENGNLLEKEIRAKNKHEIPQKIMSGQLQLKNQPLTKNEFGKINQILHGEGRMIPIKYF